MVYSEQSDADQVQVASNAIQRVLSFRLDPRRRKNVEALTYVYKGELESASRVWIDLLREFPQHSRGLTNFGYFLFHLGTIIQSERALKMLDFGEMVERGTPQSIKFYLSLLLATGHDHAERAVERHFLNRIVDPNVRDTSGDRTIFFWHIPKCAGTSVKQVLGDHFYDAPIGEVLPGYSMLPLLTYCVRHRLERFPFFTSSHKSVSTLGSADRALEFAIFRDPLARALSMFRQTLQGMHRRYPLKILPKYGHAWNYWQASDAERMLEAIPETLLLKQLSTFSDNLDVGEAERRIERLDNCLFLDGERAFNDLFDEIGVEVRESDMERLNASPKDVSIDEDIKCRIKRRLRPEYRLFERVLPRRAHHTK